MSGGRRRTDAPIYGSNTAISGLYFYKPEEFVSEPFFRAMLRDVLDIKRRTKEEGLGEFAARRFLLIDATHAH
jgi:hypothetical protein